MKLDRNKQYKIKSYDKIFSSSGREKKRRVRNTIFFVAAILILAFLGYSVFGPLMNFFKGKKTDRETKPSDSASSQITSSQKKDTEKLEQSAGISNYQMACMPLEYFSDSEKAADFAKKVKDLGYNAVVLELKAENGSLLYNSKLEMAGTVNAVSTSAVADISQTIKAIKRTGVVPVAKISAFKDTVATKNPEAKIKYVGKSGWSWFDGANGKPWLNPYSDVAQKYVTDIACELASLGFEDVMVSNIMFPSVRSFTHADFGEKEKTVSHSDSLKSFTALLQKAVNAKNAALIVSYDAVQADNPSNIIYGGANPAEIFTADAFVVSAQAGDQSVEALKALGEKLLALKTKSEFVIEVSAEQYNGAEQLSALRTAVKDCGIYLFSQTGLYSE